MRTALALILLLAAGPARPDAPRKSCTDAVPKECAKVQFLGEEGDCACFVCNPGTKTRKVVCTNDDATKRALHKLREDAAPEKPSGAPKGASR